MHTPMHFRVDTTCVASHLVHRRLGFRECASVQPHSEKSKNTDTLQTYGLDHLTDRHNLRGRDCHLRSMAHRESVTSQSHEVRDKQAKDVDKVWLVLRFSRC